MADFTNDTVVRQRKAAGGASQMATNAGEPNKKKLDEKEDAYSPWVDILRVLSFLFLASCALSYLISSGETFFWGMKHPPDYLRSAWWKAKISGPQYFTLDELSKYDGSDPEKPIYLAINGTIYDVSAGRRVYGPGGSYNYFAGVDASRGFVTGCFREDRTGDMRGVEQMYLPKDDPEIDRHWTAADMTKLKEQELVDAKKRVYDALKHWVDFFAHNKKYPYVGVLKREPGWEGKPKKLCKQAEDGRTTRQIP